MLSSWMAAFIFLIVLCVGGIFVLWHLDRKRGKKWRLPTQKFPKKWKSILHKYVPFYNALNPAQKRQFEYEIQEFLLNCKITGVKTTVEDINRVLIAASGVIPTFSFPEWKYYNLQEVYLYPDRFNHKFELEGEERNILGMVGMGGYMEGKMLLSKRALQHGFKNETDKQNTAIHEFVHLIDKADGSIDGIPHVLLKKQYVLPWLNMIDQEIEKIQKGKSDIRPYGGTSRIEFFAVLCEYFFETPQLLQRKHEQLYEMLEMIFNQDMEVFALNVKEVKISRNVPCPCGSGKKYKRCCEG